MGYQCHHVEEAAPKPPSLDLGPWTVPIFLDRNPKNIENGRFAFRLGMVTQVRNLKAPPLKVS
jgi:hypothetical protein